MSPATIEANYSQWSNTLLVIDVAWHVLHGAAVGAVVGMLLRRFSRGGAPQGQGAA